jgi:hypothetical protein
MLRGVESAPLVLISALVKVGFGYVSAGPVMEGSGREESGGKEGGVKAVCQVRFLIGTLCIAQGGGGLDTWV